MDKEYNKKDLDYSTSKYDNGKISQLAGKAKALKDSTIRGK